jgi:hypothetical protein
MSQPSGRIALSGSDPPETAMPMSLACSAITAQRSLPPRRTVDRQALHL